MSLSFTILHALSDKQEAASLVEPIQAKFPEAEQHIFTSGDLLSELRSRPYRLLFLDNLFESAYPITETFRMISADFPELIIILITEPGTPDQAQIGLQHGTLFYLARPVDPGEITFCVNHCRALFTHRQHSAKRKKMNSTLAISGFIGKSNTMNELFKMIRRVAEDDFSTVLIRGESGTGKELVAKAIHQKSSRRKHRFVPVNCAAIPDELLESELFGHLKGSFTGAGQNKTGRIQYADNGTLFLDEIGDMKPNLQAKLLRVLQEREFEPVGSLKPTPVNTRIVAATHCNLESLVKEGLFREDLYYRLSVVPIEVPPLRSRSDDIPLLLEEFVDRYTTKRGRDKIVFSNETIEVLAGYEWRGNVRELENLVQHMSILYSGKRVHPHHLPPKFTAHIKSTQTIAPALEPSPSCSIHDISAERAALFASAAPPKPSVCFDDGPISFNELINEFETELIIEAMKFTAGNKKEASRMLGLKRTTLLEKIKKKQIDQMWE